MYDYNPIFAKSFSRYERRRLGCCAVLLCFVVALSVPSTLKPCLDRVSTFGHYAANLPLHSIDDAQDMLVIDDEVEDDDPTTVHVNAAEDFQLPSNLGENIEVGQASLRVSKKIATETKNVAEPICRASNAGGDYCEIEGDIRIQPNSSTITVLTPHQTSSNPTNSWTINPYPRKHISNVRNWTINIVQSQNIVPECTKNHTNPAILFSLGGFSGNYFHDFADILFPLYSSTSHLQKRIHFLATDHKPWWINKYRRILNKLTKHEIINVNRENQQVYCFDNIIIGLKFHKELIQTPSGPSMHAFRHLLRQTFSLERKKAVRLRVSGKGPLKKPRLMIISRKRTRTLTNEADVVALAKNLGYEVVLAEASLATDISRFARTVNSCDVLLGVHGAGLTNMVFLPDHAVLIQIVPFGEIDEFAKLDFENPRRGMNLRYMEYKVSMEESSLSKEYPVDHPVLKDPESYRRKGWGAIWSIYLDKQNVSVDLQRLEGTLVKAFKVLQR